MAFKLKPNILSGIHLVDKGAAIGSDILIIKRRDANGSPEETMDPKKLAAAISKAVSESVVAILAKADDAPPATKTPEQSIEELIEEHIKDENVKMLLKTLIAAVAQSPAAEPAPAPAPAPTEPTEKADEVAPEDPAPKEEDEAMVKALKALPADVRKVLKDALASARESKDDAIAKREATDARIATAEEEIAKNRAEKDMAEQVVVAKKYLKASGDIKKRAAVLLTLKKSSPEAYDHYVSELSSHHAMVEKAQKEGKYTSGGTTRVDGDDSVNSDERSADDQLTDIAKKMVKERVEKGESKLTFEGAYRKAGQLNPELKALAKAQQH